MGVSSGSVVVVVNRGVSSTGRTENGFGVVKFGAEGVVLFGLPGAFIFVGRVETGGDSDLVLFFVLLRGLLLYWLLVSSSAMDVSVIKVSLPLIVVTSEKTLTAVNYYHVDWV